MLDIIRVPIGYIIKFCYWLIPNYAAALFLFALIMKIILFPLSIKQQKNTVRQASLRPKEQAIRNKYAGGNQQKMNEDLMKLYQDEHYSPYGGCLPLILQLIIVLALYAVVLNPLHYIKGVKNENIENINYKICEMYADGEIDDAAFADSTLKQITKTAESIKKYKADKDNNDKPSAPAIQGIETVRIVSQLGIDNFKDESMLGADFEDEDLPSFYLVESRKILDLAKTPAFKCADKADYWLLLIPLLTFVFTFGSMKLTKKMTYQPPQASDDANAALSMKIMDYTMPAISTFFCFQVPAVVAVYWIYQNILSTLQQFVLKKMYPYPEFTEADYKAASKELNKGSKSIDKKAKKSSGKVAAHRIDLMDDAPVEKTVDAAEEKAPDTGNDIIGHVRMKDESDRNKD